jgi:3-hydroxymyristoyl/3-hydroxydecanoyl-(acyl carrier protein) dehydratase
MDFPVEDIIPLIPQKPPFVMVGKLLYTDEIEARSSFLIEEGNVFVRDGYFQEAGLLENMAQTAALGAGYQAKRENRPVVSGYIAAINNLEIFGLPRTGDELITEVKIENHIFNVTVISGKVWNNGEVIASGEMKLFSVSE